MDFIDGLGTADPARRPALSIVSPAYNEAENLPAVYECLAEAVNRLGVDWEWVIVDDHSSDGTFAAIAGLARRDPAVRGIRLARNFGSHMAVTCGLHHARGDCAAVIAADAQEPPEMLAPMLEKWREGAHVVWAVRQRREGEGLAKVGSARLYYLLMRWIVGMKEIPATGADCFLIDRRVIEAFRQFNESNTSIVAILTWMGFRQASIQYVRRPRASGRSKWTFAKKLKLVVDSITSFSYFPIRLMSYAGFTTALLGFCYAALIVVNALVGHPVSGWSSLMIVLLVIGGIQMMMMGVLGEYLYRALDESRRRPRFLIETTTEETESLAAAALAGDNGVRVSGPR